MEYEPNWLSSSSARRIAKQFYLFENRACWRRREISIFRECNFKTCAKRKTKLIWTWIGYWKCGYCLNKELYCDFSSAERGIEKRKKGEKANFISVNVVFDRVRRAHTLSYFLVTLSARYSWRHEPIVYDGYSHTPNMVFSKPFNRFIQFSMQRNRTMLPKWGRNKITQITFSFNYYSVSPPVCGKWNTSSITIYVVSRTRRLNFPWKKWERIKAIKNGPSEPI